jgi:hypothetical protein
MSLSLYCVHAQSKQQKIEDLIHQAYVATTGPKQELYAQEENLFLIDEGRQQIAVKFVKDEAGHVVALSFKNRGKSVTHFPIIVQISYLYRDRSGSLRSLKVRRVLPNEKIREAFILRCYTGMRWCDVKALHWQQVNKDRMVSNIAQRIIKVENTITLHP